MKRASYESISMVEEAFATVFDKSVCIETKRVGKGGTSANVYVPLKYVGYPVTVIIWDKDEKEDEVQESEDQEDREDREEGYSEEDDRKEVDEETYEDEVVEGDVDDESDEEVYEEVYEDDEGYDEDTYTEEDTKVDG